MSNTFGRYFRITTWGESHGYAVGVVIDGCPAGLQVTEESIEKELARDVPLCKVSTGRREPNSFKIMSGVYNDLTIGTPISVVIFNRDVDSSSYKSIENTPRPGHGDLTWKLKYGVVDPRGGSRASGRECVARVAGAAVARLLLRQIGIQVTSKVTELAGVFVDGVEGIEDAVEKVQTLGKDGHSTGGKITVTAKGMPSGLGTPVFDKLQARIGQAMLSIGGVKSIDIGIGRDVAGLTGTESNDLIGFENGKPVTLSNRCGGILGGISTGSDVVIHLSVKPTPTHRVQQATVDLSTNAQTTIQCSGRHDLNFTPRVAVVAEAMLALVLTDEAIGCQLLPSVTLQGFSSGEGNP